jgi:YggT family protein
MIIIISKIISSLANLIVLLVIVDSILSYFLNPYHPVRNALDRVLEPLLTPIRRVVPLVGMFDLSPLILIVLVEILSYALISFLSAL